MEASCPESTWTGSCVEIHVEGSATGRQSRICEEAGLCRDSRDFGGFDAREGTRHLQVPLRLGCPCIHPVEGPKPHEYTSVTDCYGETESGGLVIASESGS